MLTKRVLELAQKFESEVIEIRRAIHQWPELAFEEQRTSELIIAKLEELDLEIESALAQTGVCALQRNSRGEGPTILLRADMDALPIQEETDLDFASQNAGVMHACGHDAHVAILLGAAMLLNELESELQGNIKFLFQPAEEKEGGAKKMIEEGVLKNPAVDGALGLHVWGSAPKGVIEWREGPIMAAPDRFCLRIFGQGGHAAQPQNCIDPIPLAAQVITALQNIVSRKNNPLEPLVVSVCRLEAGDAFNIIPNQVLLEGTVRTFNQELRAKVPQMMEDIIRGIVKGQGGDYELDYIPYFPPVVNDPQLTELFKGAAQKVLGSQRVQRLKEPTMGGEDFSYFAEAVPAAFFFLGIAPSAKEPIQHHHPQFSFDDSILKEGVAVLAQAAIDFLNI